jgi:hypothetical protein
MTGLINVDQAEDVRKSSDFSTLLTMSASDLAACTDALYLSWRLRTPDTTSVDLIRRRLNQGEIRHLYRLRSWVIVGGEVRALLSPAVTLDRIARAIWGDHSQPVSTRWVRQQDCARVSRDIERVPVHLGLASRPEQWPFSSAATH